MQEKTRQNWGSFDTLNSILKEIRSLRQDIFFFLPYENLDEYVHSPRVKRSYQKAIKRYPPTGVWK